MFTGIVEYVSKMEIRGNTLVIENPFDDVKIGDSIAVNGVCLTATAVGRHITFTCGLETLKRTNLGIWNGREANIERALPVNGRFDGHIVTGHIDGTIKFLKSLKERETTWMTFSMPRERWGIAEKGSIAINGISLTIAKIDLDTFTVQVIPHTFENTNLRTLHPGDIVNYEIDVIARYLKGIYKG
ncbi:MAG: riboflavin synthase [Kosmotoga sp.]|nr:riboflavin synthase [Kosmotoga sp.]